MEVKLQYRKMPLHCYVENATHEKSTTIEFKFEFCWWHGTEYSVLDELIVTAEELSGFYLMLLADGWVCRGQY